MRCNIINKKFMFLPVDIYVYIYNYQTQKILKKFEEKYIKYMLYSVEMQKMIILDNSVAKVIDIYTTKINYSI